MQADRKGRVLERCLRDGVTVGRRKMAWSCKKKRNVQTATETWYPETTIKMGGKTLPLVPKPFAGAIWQAVLLVEAELPRTMLSNPVQPLCALQCWQHRAVFTSLHPTLDLRGKEGRLASF